MKGAPWNSPTSWMTTMFSWLQRAVVRASSRKRWLISGAVECRNLIATRRPSRVSRARNTVPMPPLPSSRISSYWLSRVPGAGFLPVSGAEGSERALSKDRFVPGLKPEDRGRLGGQVPSSEGRAPPAAGEAVRGRSAAPVLRWVMFSERSDEGVSLSPRRRRSPHHPRLRLESETG